MLIITGPTATGKTDLALSLAKKYQGELIACDSRQVYKGLDIGSGKLPGKEARLEKHNGYWVVDGIKIHLYDIANPAEQFDLYQFLKVAKQVLLEMDKETVPILVGGAGLYLDSLVSGLETTATDSTLRVELEKKSLLELQSILQTKSAQLLESLNNSERNNSRRLVRHIEKLTFGQPVSQSGIGNDYRYLKIGLTTSVERLNLRVDERVDKRLKAGMVEEAQYLHGNGLSFERMRQLGLEYRCLADFLEEKMSYQDFVTTLKTKIHQYAKRQLTWFKRDEEIHWFDIEDGHFSEDVDKLFIEWRS